ncbi:MAG: PilZ domain-containing protein [Lachnospiraceae bacterium]|nr:PilZ domain-containing protein [Lachnospiraceae bacterium]
MQLLQLEKGSTATIYAEQGGKSIKFKQRIKRITKEEEALLREKIGKMADFCVIEPVMVKGRMVSFAVPGIVCSVLGIIDSRPYRWSNINLARVSFPQSGNALVAYTAGMGAKYERRGSYRAVVGINGTTRIVKEGSKHSTLIKDVSMNGIGLVVPKDFSAKIGDNINIQYSDTISLDKLDSQYVKFDLDAFIVREQPLDANRKIIGCRLTAGDRNMLSRYISSKQKKSLQYRSARNSDKTTFVERK